MGWRGVAWRCRRGGRGVGGGVAWKAEGAERAPRISFKGACHIDGVKSWFSCVYAGAACVRTRVCAHARVCTCACIASMCVHVHVVFAPKRACVCLCACVGLHARIMRCVAPGRPAGCGRLPLTAGTLHAHSQAPRTVRLAGHSTRRWRTWPRCARAGRGAGWARWRVEGCATSRHPAAASLRLNAAFPGGLHLS